MTAIADQLTDIASQLVTLANQTSATPDDAEALARRFHEAYERLAPAFGYQTREASAKPWEQVPDNNRALMTAVCAELLAGGQTSAAPDVLADIERLEAIARERTDQWPSSSLSHWHAKGVLAACRSMRLAVCGQPYDLAEPDTAKAADAPGGAA